MIVVDTSAWISALRSGSSPVAPFLASLLDADEILLVAPVRTELLGGARAAERPRLRKLLTALPIAYPDDATWTLMDQWIAHAGDRGQRFGMGDLLIAAIARQAGALVWSLDADFRRMARLKFVGVYDP